MGKTQGWRWVLWELGYLAFRAWEAAVDPEFGKAEHYPACAATKALQAAEQGQAPAVCWELFQGEIKVIF